MTLAVAVRTRLEKAASDNGFDLDGAAHDDWIHFASSQAPLHVWLTARGEGVLIAALSQPNVLQGLAELGVPFASALPFHAFGARSVPDFAALHRLLRRAFQLSRTLPDELLRTFQEQTATLPRSTEVERLVVQRIGQDLFRRGLMEYWDGRCTITGLAVPELLRASHIKPWADCETDAERLDVFNGLLLAPHLDAAFDAGFITVGTDGKVLVSDALGAEARAILGLDDTLKMNRVTASHVHYLRWHKDRIFRGASSADAGKNKRRVVDDDPLNKPLRQGRELRKLSGHGGPVLAIKCSADGERAISGSADGTIRLWDLKQGTELRQIDFLGRCELISFTADLGRAAWSDGSHNTFRLAGCEGEDLDSMPGSPGHTMPVLCLAIAGDGKRVVSASADRSLRVWDVATRQPISQIEGLESVPTCIDITSDGSLAVSGDRFGVVCIWTLQGTIAEVHRIRAHSEKVTSVTLSPDETKIVSTSRDRVVRIWDVASGREICAFDRHANEVTAACFSPDGRLVVSGGYSSLASRNQSGQVLTTTDAVRAWDSATGREICNFGAPVSPVLAIECLPDNSSVLIGGGGYHPDDSAVQIMQSTIGIWTLADTDGVEIP